MNNKTTIVIAGEGGQGIQTIAKVFTEAVFDSNKKVSYMPSFGVEQRGAPSVAFLSVSSKALRYPKFQIADIAIIMQSRAINAVKSYINPNTKVIFDSSAISKSDLPENATKLFGLPAIKHSAEKFSSKALNMIVLGMLANQVSLDKKSVWEKIIFILGKKFKNDSIRDINKTAFEFGYDLLLEQDVFSKAQFKTKHKEIVYKNDQKLAKILPARCKGCGICIEKCPVGALSFGDTLGVFATPVPEIDLEKCIACGNCRNFCPDAAIGVDKIKKNS